MSDGKQKQENPWISLIFNIVLPTIVLTKFSGSESLGPAKGLLFSLSFPLFYGIFDLAKRRKYNFISILGFVSILLTGGLGLLQISGFWFAVKEASIPLLIGLFLLGSMKTKKPLIRMFFYNDTLLNVNLIDDHLTKSGGKSEFEKLMTNCSYLVVTSFLLSAMINFILAYFIIKGEPGTAEFNKQLGFMNAVSFPVILVFCTGLLFFALWRLVKGLTTLTGLTTEQLFAEKKS